MEIDNPIGLEPEGCRPGPDSASGTGGANLRWQTVCGEPDGVMQKIDITFAADRTAERKERRTLTTASQVAFANDGLEVAFIAGGDLWVMDTILREPKQVTDTPEEESEPQFTADQSALIYVSNRGLRHGPPEVLARLAQGEGVDPATYYFRTTPTFETGTPHYAWLNDVITICAGCCPGGELHPRPCAG